MRGAISGVVEIGRPDFDMYNRWVVSRKPDNPLGVRTPDLDGILDPIDHPVPNRGVNVLAVIPLLVIGWRNL